MKTIPSWKTSWKLLENYSFMIPLHSDHTLASSPFIRLSWITPFEYVIYFLLVTWLQKEWWWLKTLFSSEISISVCGSLSVCPFVSLSVSAFMFPWSDTWFCSSSLLIARISLEWDRVELGAWRRWKAGRETGSPEQSQAHLGEETS